MAAKKKTQFKVNPPAKPKGKDSLNGSTKTIPKPGTKGGKVFVPGQSGPASIPTLRPEDLIALADRESGWTSELGNLWAALQGAQADKEFGDKQLDQERTGRESAATDSSIGRGLFRSSIRQNALTDIGADIALRKSRLDDGVRLAQNAYTFRKGQIEGTGGEREQIHVPLMMGATERAREQDALRPPTPGKWIDEALVKKFVAGGTTVPGGGTTPTPRPRAGATDPHKHSGNPAKSQLRSVLPPAKGNRGNVHNPGGRR